MNKRKTVITMDVDIIDMQNAIKNIGALTKDENGHYVCVSNVHMCIETYNDQSFRGVVNSADLVIADGKPISWAQKLLGANEAQQVRGMDITLQLCAFAEKENISIGFYGATDITLNQIKQQLLVQYPKLNIAYQYSPPFRELNNDEQHKIIRDINNSGAKILFVGLGCPKQERWMAQHKDQLNCVMLGVGAAFDFIAGNKKHAPAIMQKLGLEWFYRLLSEPKRLWRRYLSTNPKFVLLFIMQLMGKNFK